MIRINEVSNNTKNDLLALCKHFPDLVFLQREKTEYIYSELVTLAQRTRITEDFETSNRILDLAYILGKEIDA